MTSLPASSTNVERRGDGPFAQLVRLFAGRIFHGGGDTTDGELDVSLGVVLSLLALPGGFYSICLFEKYSTLLLRMRGQQNFDPLAATVSDEYFFIVLSMVVTGAVAVWRWDSIFPDRRDFANLVPLPIPTRVIFLTNFAAILILALLLALVVNAASAVIFPLAVSASQQSFSYLVQLAGIHALTVFLASLFSFFAVFAMVGTLMVAMPYAAFRRFSLYLRAVLLVFFVEMLCTSFAVPSMISRMPYTTIRFLPSVWFLALTQLIHGTASPPVASLGWFSLRALGLVAVIAIATYVVSYRRRFARIPEVMDTDLEPGRRYASWWFALCDRSSSVRDTASCGRPCCAASITAWCLAASSAWLLSLPPRCCSARSTATRSAPAACLRQPFFRSLILSYCILVGLRFVFEMPTELRANWIFQLSVDRDSHECLPLARKVALSCIVPWVVAIVLPVYRYLWGVRVAVFHGVVVTLWSTLLAQVLFARFRKVPFTCSYPPFRDSALMIVLLYLLGFFVFVVFVSNLEYRALLNLFFAIPLLLTVPAAWYGLSLLQQEVAPVDRQLIFEEHATVGFELLDLEQRS